MYAWGSNLPSVQRGKKILQNSENDEIGTWSHFEENPTFPPRSSGSSLISNNYKQTSKDEPALESGDALRRRLLKSSLERLALDDEFKIGLNDLEPIARSWDGEFDLMLASVEHLAFYLRSHNAKGIQQPRGWFLKQLRLGYYAEPADFVSWEQKQMEAVLRDKRAKIAKLRLLAEQDFDLDFENWLQEQDKNAVKGVLKASHPHLEVSEGSPMGRAALRQFFAKKTGREHLGGGGED